MIVKDNVITGENIARTILLVAAPTMLQMLLQTSYHLVDAIWIGMLGPVALAAVASASFILWMIFSGCSLVEIGVSSLTARYFGAGDKKSFQEISVYGLRFSILVSFLIAVLFIYTSGFMLEQMGLEADVIASAELFMLPMLAGLPLYALMITTFAIFRGTGDTRTPLKILLLSILLNGILTPALIFGIAFIPAYGIAGGAVGTVISHITALIFAILILRKKELITAIKGAPVSWKYFGKITGIGLPITVNSIIFCFIYLFITRIVSQFGTAPVAAMGIGHRIESLAFCISVGFSIATTTLVGQSLGAKDARRAEKTVWIISYYSGAVMLLISLLIMLFSSQIVDIFTTDPAVKKAAMGYLFAIACTEIFLAFEIVMEGAFSGAGNTMPLTIVGIPANILRIPLAWYLAGKYGIDGVWWTIAISTVLKGVLLVIWFKYTNLEKYIHNESPKQPVIRDDNISPSFT